MSPFLPLTRSFVMMALLLYLSPCLDSFSLKSDTRSSRFRPLCSSNDDDDNLSSNKIRFLGRGSNAIVRPGVVLVAPLHEYNHFLLKSAIFVHAMGYDDHEEYVVRGVIIDHPTPFTMNEMGTSVVGPLAENLMFRGGNDGSDTAIMLHSYDDSSAETENEIGTSGIYEGGLDRAMEACIHGKASPEQFKFFFNYCQFSEAELEHMLAATDSNGDAWTSVELINAPHFVLNSDYNRGDAWSRLRNAISQMKA